MKRKWLACDTCMILSDTCVYTCIQAHARDENLHPQTWQRERERDVVISDHVRTRVAVEPISLPASSHPPRPHSQPLPAAAAQEPPLDLEAGGYTAPAQSPGQLSADEDGRWWGADGDDVLWAEAPSPASQQALANALLQSMNAGVYAVCARVCPGAPGEGRACLVCY